MKSLLTVFGIGLVMTSAQVWGANQGRITAMYFSGTDSTFGVTHNDILQLEIEGGFLQSGCNSSYAAIRKSDEHLVSAALTAYATNKPITVYLNSAVTYFDGSRCVITDLIMVP